MNIPLVRLANVDLVESTIGVLTKIDSRVSICASCGNHGCRFGQVVVHIWICTLAAIRMGLVNDEETSNYADEHQASADKIRQSPRMFGKETVL